MHTRHFYHQCQRLCKAWNPVTPCNQLPSSITAQPESFKKSYANLMSVSVRKLQRTREQPNTLQAPIPTPDTGDVPPRRRPPTMGSPLTFRPRFSSPFRPMQPPSPAPASLSRRESLARWRMVSSCHLLSQIHPRFSKSKIPRCIQDRIRSYPPPLRLRNCALSKIQVKIAPRPCRKMCQLQIWGQIEICL